MIESEENAYEIIHFPNGGNIRVHRLVSRDDSDFNSLFAIARFFAQEGRHVVLSPKMTRPPLFMYSKIYGSLEGTPYEGKCPDLLIDGLWYEYEGFITNNPKRAFSNMVNHGMSQSNRLILESPSLTSAYMKRVINQRIRDGHKILEVLLWDGQTIKTLYKKFEE